MNPWYPVHRRDFLRGAAAVAAGIAVGGCGDDASTPAGTGRPSVAVLGGGAAGVFAAWLLDGAFDVTVYEAEAKIGGNVKTYEYDMAGERVVIDLGAQYFHPGPYPLYTRLLEHLGLRNPDGTAGDGTWRAPASMTVSVTGEANPRFVSPISPGREWPTSTAWNQPGVQAFFRVSTRGKKLETEDGDWSIALEDWYRDIGLNDDQRDNIMLPWAASLFSGSVTEARRYSARAALTFLTRATSSLGIEPIVYNTLVKGMAGPLETLLAACKTTTVRTGAKVARIERAGARVRITETGGRSAVHDRVVIAAPAYAASAALGAFAGVERVRAALDRFEFHAATLLLHRDPAYAPAVPDNRSFLNVLAYGTSSEGSMRLADVVKPPRADTPVDLWKSWATYRERPPVDVLAEVKYKHMLPSTQTVAAQADLDALQGEGGLLFVGGWTHSYDSQETALLSAWDAAVRLGVANERTRLLEGFAAGPPPTFPV